MLDERSWWTRRGGAATLVIIFLTALVPRVVVVLQYADAPNLDNPIGDSRVYVERARAILAGDWLGEGAYFHSSPLYPYLMALVLRLTGGSFLALRLAQSVVGSLGCVAIALLAGRVAPESRFARVIAGLAAAFYGTLAFFDADLLMIPLTVVLVSCCLLLLLRARDSGSNAEAVLAGITLGVAASDKTNLLLFVPFAAWFLATSFSRRPDRWRWKPALLFTAATLAVILPITSRNLAVGGDLILVSSNAGVNLFIGNNPEARGVYELPPRSGLKNYDLQGSSTAVAELELGHEPKPSQVSRFWAGKALRFATTRPGRETVHVGLKLRRLASAYEVPNHLNAYYMRTEFIPALGWLFTGAWLVFPLGLAGICWRWIQGADATDRLLTVFLLVYAASLMPFFITARYRLPLVPVLVAYAAIAAVQIVPSWRTARPGARRALVAVLACSILAVHWPAERFGYSHNRVAMAARYFDRFLADPEARSGDLDESILQLKWALETAPGSADAHHNLGCAYEHVGYYSGAEREFRMALGIDPGRKLSREGLNNVSRKRARRGDRVGPQALPLTPFERAVLLESSGRPEDAERLYLEILDRDPFHEPARGRL